MEGTYPLPEAQLDRFMFNVVMDYLPEDDEVAVVMRTTAGRAEPIEALFTGEDVLSFHDIVRKVPVAEEIVRYAVQLAAASRPHQAGTPDFVNEWVSWGAGTRAGQFLVLGAKARALFKGRAHVTVEDIQHAGLSGAAAPRPAELPRRSRRASASTMSLGACSTRSNRRSPHDLACTRPGWHRFASRSRFAGIGASFIDPQTLMSIRNLELRARVVVEGFWSGLHRSPYHGFSVEFTEYRQYTPGDDPRYLDWRVFARSDRYFIKRFEDETNLRCHLLVDSSRSMTFGSLGYTKAELCRHPGRHAGLVPLPAGRRRRPAHLRRADPRLPPRAASHRPSAPPDAGAGKAARGPVHRPGCAAEARRRDGAQTRADGADFRFSRARSMRSSRTW